MPRLFDRLLDDDAPVDENESDAERNLRYQNRLARCFGALALVPGGFAILLGVVCLFFPDVRRTILTPPEVVQLARVPLLAIVVLVLRSRPLAARTLAGIEIVVTLVFMALSSAPLVIEGGQVDARSDLYALGAVGYLLLTGRAVFVGRSEVDLARQHLHDAPLAPSTLVPSIAPELDALVLRCLAKSPSARPPSAAALLTELLHCAAHHPFDAKEARRWWLAHPAAQGQGHRHHAEPGAPESAVSIPIDLRQREPAITHREGAGRRN